MSFEFNLSSEDLEEWTSGKGRFFDEDHQTVGGKLIRHDDDDSGRKERSAIVSAFASLHWCVAQKMKSDDGSDE
jgi:hypothetical protein